MPYLFLIGSTRKSRRAQSAGVGGGGVARSEASSDNGGKQRRRSLEEAAVSEEGQLSVDPRAGGHVGGEPSPRDLYYKGRRQEAPGVAASVMQVNQK